MTAGRYFAAALALALLGGAALGGDDRLSGFDFLGPQTRAMQQDDMSNPGMLSVLDGEALWNRAAGAPGRSCADCHGDAAASMRGVAARYPAYDEQSGRPVTLEGRILQCRETRQQAEPFDWESPDLLALSAYVAHQSRGLPVETGADPRLAPFVESGRDLFTGPKGQLDFSCADCHEDNWGRHLGGAVIPQAHPTGYPIYRLEWQSMGSLQRRLRNCMTGVRAEPYAYGSPEHAELELFLMARARGLPMETPGVRP
ncbi:sulfur oxidation c-type cytochrome SoxA [Skermanella mucosa]|uniref:sulfur oxidation c-type cytochrome SoxA n=1 Tax=Skermanella mucosa TaxID=1789672 RepID=UPI001E483BE8|nr:sulfur oxidation c-type cytochrome SoxA [Skermanella mucosa]UEM19919.1 sulfur oxidation c-type cytochrome SoxA [Skermanella mucosa]